MLKKVVLSILLAFVSTQSFASLISGQFDFNGLADLTRNGDGSAYLQIDYVDAPTAGSPKAVIATGDFGTYITYGDDVTVTDPWNMTAPQTALWSVGGFTFDLSAIIINDGSTVGGNGVITGNGFEATNGYWSFTSQSDNSGTFSFSSTTVPAPGIVLLLGIGLAGISLTRRFRKT